MTNLRSQPRRRVYLGEGLTFELRSRVSRLDAEAVDVSADGMGLVVSGGAVMLAIGEVVTLSRGDVQVSAVVRRVGRLRGAAADRGLVRGGRRRGVGVPVLG